MKSFVSRADLIRAAAVSDKLLDSFAHRLGYVVNKDNGNAPEDESTDVVPDRIIGEGPMVVGKSPDPAPKQAPLTSFQPSPIDFWCHTKTNVIKLGTKGSVPPSVPMISGDPWRSRPIEIGLNEPLASDTTLRTNLRKRLSQRRPTGDVDIRRTVDVFCRGEFVNRLPRYPQRRWGDGLVVIVDRSRHLFPYFEQYRQVISLLDAIYSEDQVRLAYVFDGSTLPKWSDRSAPDQLVFPAGVQVLCLTDLGLFRKGQRQIGSAWRRIGRLVQSGGCRTTVLFPGHVRWCNDRIRRAWNVVPWSGSSRGIWSVDSTAQLTDQLVALCSPAIRIEPDLLRTVRRRTPRACFDAALESLVWQHESVDGSSTTAAQIRTKTRQHLLTNRESGELADFALQTVRQTHSALHAAVWFEELVSLFGHDDPILETSDREDALRYLAAFSGKLKTEIARHGLNSDAAVWVRAFSGRLPSTCRNDRELVKLLDPLLEQAFPRPGGITQAAAESFCIRQSGNQLQIVRTSEPFGGGTLASIRTTNRSIRLIPGNEITKADPFWECGRAPEWADAWGRDEFGPWVDLRVPKLGDDAAESVGVRMRWVPAGTFLMGSPDDEEGRYSDEGPQHEVTITNGFWMFDAPVTQGLWEAAMGDNPSNFKAVNRPVEQVSWEDCQKFIERLNQRVTGLDIGLPSEAEWEFACRGGTTGPTYDDNDDRLSIAWFNENAEIETHAVRQKKPNSRGLYDMLGNVYEWCQDQWREPYATDPLHEPDATASANRVVRGGSWGHDARYVRAAYRYRFSPGFRNGLIGFRCRVQASELSKPAEQHSEGGASVERQSRSGAGGVSETMSAPRAQRLEGDAFLSRVREIGLDRLTKPEWASSWGTDELGIWADMLYGEKRKSAKQRLRLIPPGRFLMGSPEDEEGRFDGEGPQHEVTISTAFWMFESSCTQLMWRMFVGSSPGKFKGGDLPVESVSWDDCQTFLQVMPAGFGLPSEAEWEYACRAGTTSKNYHTSDDLKAIAWFSANSKHTTHPLRQKIPNSWGLYDMLGNVHEWCQDVWLREYTADALIDPLHEPDANASAHRVVRGGSWHYDARYVRAACRSGYSPVLRSIFIGFRCRVQASELQQAVERHEGEGSVERRSRSGAGGVSETTSGTRVHSLEKAVDSHWVNLVDRDSDSVPVPQSPVIRVISDVEEVTLRKISRPSWSTAMGRDKYGLWCEFEVPENLSGDSKPIGFQRSRRPRQRTDVVVQRLRWVPPGSFQFGSPMDEAGRWDSEFEATTEVMEAGFWVFDTPVTQQLWEAVMGQHPSHFISPTRPVEQVSWTDSQEFFKRISEVSGKHQLPPLDLLTEREWECACRAGTTDASYAGAIEFIGDGNAPVLDDIAVYSGNCGVDWDLPSHAGAQPFPSELQYEFESGGTRPVGSKLPNSLGLYDTLGNVFEWCSDLWHGPGEELDESADIASAFRVVRGGSWNFNARYVRAASRSRISPVTRHRDLGFRCRVRELKAAEQHGEGSASVERRSRSGAGGASETTSETRASNSEEKRGVFERLFGRSSDKK